MGRHLAHERRRLRLIATPLALIGMLVAVGHTIEDAEGRSLLPVGLGDLIFGYPSAFAFAMFARLVWLRARRRAVAQPKS